MKNAVEKAKFLLSVRTVPRSSTQERVGLDGSGPDGLVVALGQWPAMPTNRRWPPDRPKHVSIQGDIF